MGPSLCRLLFTFGSKTPRSVVVRHFLLAAIGLTKVKLASGRLAICVRFGQPKAVVRRSHTKSRNANPENTPQIFNFHITSSPARVRRSFFDESELLKWIEATATTTDSSWWVYETVEEKKNRRRCKRSFFRIETGPEWLHHKLMSGVEGQSRSHVCDSRTLAQTCTGHINICSVSCYTNIRILRGSLSLSNPSRCLFFPHNFMAHMTHREI